MINIVVPIAKVDVEKRLVIGRAVQEIPDRSGEILDYATAKPAFQEWSQRFQEATGGQSQGNLRVMHGKQVAGKVVKLDYNDADKAIDVIAKVVDDNEWNKVLEGCYTGFSVGGAYAKSWQDPTDPTKKRYTPRVSELSLVDSPCIPTARIYDLVKADGIVEQKTFKSVELVDRLDSVLTGMGLEKFDAALTAFDEILEKDDSKKTTIKNVMHRWKAGELKSGSGQTVTDQKQAIAIALHEADDPETYGDGEGAGKVEENEGLDKGTATTATTVGPDGPFKTPPADPPAPKQLPITPPHAPSKGVDRVFGGAQVGPDRPGVGMVTKYPKSEWVKTKDGWMRAKVMVGAPIRGNLGVGMPTASAGNTKVGGRFGIFVKGDSLFAEELRKYNHNHGKDGKFTSDSDVSPTAAAISGGYFGAIAGAKIGNKVANHFTPKIVRSSRTKINITQAGKATMRGRMKIAPPMDILLGRDNMRRQGVEPKKLISDPAARDELANFMSAQSRRTMRNHILGQAIHKPLIIRGALAGAAVGAIGSYLATEQGRKNVSNAVKGAKSLFSDILESTKQHPVRAAVIGVVPNHVVTKLGSKAQKSMFVENLMKYDENHQPAGSPSGGEFAPGNGGSPGASAPKGPSLKPMQRVGMKGIAPHPAAAAAAASFRDNFENTASSVGHGALSAGEAVGGAGLSLAGHAVNAVRAVLGIASGAVGAVGGTVLGASPIGNLASAYYSDSLLGAIVHAMPIVSAFRGGVYGAKLGARVGSLGYFGGEAAKYEQTFLEKGIKLQPVDNNNVIKASQYALKCGKPGSHQAMMAFDNALQQLDPGYRANRKMQESSDFKNKLHGIANGVMGKSMFIENLMKDDGPSDPNWDESKHPRNRGKFAPKGSGNVGGNPQRREALRQTIPTNQEHQQLIQNSDAYRAVTSGAIPEQRGGIYGTLIGAAALGIPAAAMGAAMVLGGKGGRITGAVDNATQKVAGKVVGSVARNTAKLGTGIVKAGAKKLLTGLAYASHSAAFPRLGRVAARAAEGVKNISVDAVGNAAGKAGEAAGRAGMKGYNTVNRFTAEALKSGLGRTKGALAMAALSAAVPTVVGAKVGNWIGENIYNPLSYRVVQKGMLEAQLAKAGNPYHAKDGKFTDKTNAVITSGVVGGLAGAIGGYIAGRAAAGVKAAAKKGAKTAKGKAAQGIAATTLKYASGAIKATKKQIIKDSKTAYKAFLKAPLKDKAKYALYAVMTAAALKEASKLFMSPGETKDGKKQPSFISRYKGTLKLEPQFDPQYGIGVKLTGAHPDGGERHVIASYSTKEGLKYPTVSTAANATTAEAEKQREEAAKTASQQDEARRAAAAREAGLNTRFMNALGGKTVPNSALGRQKGPDGIQFETDRGNTYFGFAKSGHQSQLGAAALHNLREKDFSDSLANDYGPSQYPHSRYEDALEVSNPEYDNTSKFMTPPEVGEAIRHIMTIGYPELRRELASAATSTDAIPNHLQKHFEDTGQKVTNTMRTALRKWVSTDNSLFIRPGDPQTLRTAKQDARRRAFEIINNLPAAGSPEEAFPHSRVAPTTPPSSTPPSVREQTQAQDEHMRSIARETPRRAADYTPDHEETEAEREARMEREIEGDIHSVHSAFQEATGKRYTDFMRDAPPSQKAALESLLRQSNEYVGDLSRNHERNQAMANFRRVTRGEQPKRIVKADFVVTDALQKANAAFLGSAGRYDASKHPHKGKGPGGGEFAPTNGGSSDTSESSPSKVKTKTDVKVQQGKEKGSSIPRIAEGITNYGAMDVASKVMDHVLGATPAGKLAQLGRFGLSMGTQIATGSLASSAARSTAEHFAGPGAQLHERHNQAMGRLLGGLIGQYAGAAAGAVGGIGTGPGALATSIAGGAAGGMAGEEVGSYAGKMLDRYGPKVANRLKNYFS